MTGTQQGQIEHVTAMLKQVRAAGAKRPKRPSGPPPDKQKARQG